MQSGWICLYRALLDHWIFEESDALKLWCYLLLKANHTDRRTMFNGKLTEVKRGQIIAGRLVLSEKLQISEAKIRRYLNTLENDQMISQVKTNKYSMISIVNYDQYQSIDQQETSKSPTNNQQIATSKQLNNENKKTISVDKPPTEGPDPEDLRLAQWMYKLILDVMPKTKAPNFDKWANIIRLMQDRDGHSRTDIAHVFKWANKDGFWKLNIRSPDKLRAHYATLDAKRRVQGEGHKPADKQRETRGDRVDAALRAKFSARDIEPGTETGS